MSFRIIRGLLIHSEVALEESGGGVEEVVGSNDADQMIAFDYWKTTNTIGAHDFYCL